MNPLNIKSKKETLLAWSILFSPSFRKGRKKTAEGRKLYNKEIKYVKTHMKKYGYKMNKQPKTM